MESRQPLFGLINLDKPAGITSRQAVDRVKRLVGRAKIGHCGTLDPLASGVLVVCIGPATRLAEFVQRQTKRYRATFLLGRTSPTDDVDGEVSEIPDAPQPSRDEVVATAQELTGQILQRPPSHSALKVAGKRAYELARAGQTVELAARPVDVYSWDIVDYAYPELVVDVACSKGTYVRALGRDLAESLGTGAVMSALVRKAVGAFHVNDAVSPETLTRANLTDFLLPPSLAVVDLPHVELDADQIAMVRHGGKLPASITSPDCQELAAFNDAGQLLALLTRATDRRFKPSVNFAGR
ncbi:MAG: tRNA pseudouridine(55) synthase TruB [Pirellulales bacterium]